jgi:tape measure domain-containing protein
VATDTGLLEAFGSTSQTTFQSAATALIEAKQSFESGALTPVAFRDLREPALIKALTAMAAEMGVTLRQPCQINSNGEISVVAEQAAPSGPNRDACGSYGESFAAALSKHHPRTGVVPMAVVPPDNGWCYLNHFEAEKMVLDYFDQQKPAVAPTTQPVLEQKNPRDLLGHLMSIEPGGKSVFSLSMGNEAKATFIVYYDQQEARGDRGGRVPGLVTGEYEVWTSPTPDDLHSHKEVLRQHVSPGKPLGDQQRYAAERCAEAIMVALRRAKQ